jgi:thioredoxin reductase (NADPH)
VLFLDSDDERRGLGTRYLSTDCAGSFEVMPVSSAEESRAAAARLAGEGRVVAAAVVDARSAGASLEGLTNDLRGAWPSVRIIVYGAPPATLAALRRSRAADFTVDDPWESPDVSLQPLIDQSLRSREGRDTPQTVDVIGDSWDPRCHDLKDVLARHRIAYRTREADGGASAPRLVFADGSELIDPSDEDLAKKLGFGTKPESSFYDLVIIGGGPAGLAAAVYASSEGLRTVIVERDVPGGQAGSSALIENYLGFPDGVSGAELASRAVGQAEKFGTEILVSRTATSLRDDRGYRVVGLDDGSEIVSHCVVLATGIAYRRFTAEGAERLTGAGVYYGAAAAEAARFRDREVCLLGSGNSAAQGALLLARYARSLTIITIDEALDTTMSQYLVARISALPNIHVLTGTTVAAVAGKERVESVVVETVATRERREIETDALFVWIGGNPRTEWLEGTLLRDANGYVITGRGLHRRDLKGWPDDRWPMHLESSMPGVFVAGDARAGSVKRVGSAVGEGATAVQLVHAYLRER